MKKNSILIIVIFIAIFLLLIIFPTLNSNYKKSGNLYISEILASNNKTIADEDGDFSDYIEIYNGYGEEINLEGYHLSDSEYETNKWTFPKIKIKSHEYLIIYASGKDKCDIENRICHTNFKLSSDGEIITLTDEVGNILSKFSYNEQVSDISYGYKSGKYMYFMTPTPGKENNSEEYHMFINKQYKLEITEYMTHNKRSNYDKYGNYFDWVEIYNPTDENYTLESLYITDDITKLKKYRIPRVDIKSHEYIVIYFAGDNVDYQDGIYADFSLSDNDEYIIISNGKDIIDKVSIVGLLDNISYGKVEDKWIYFTTATPGKDNNTASFESIGGINGSS